MPHAIIKLWPGRTEEQKQLLADRITILSHWIFALPLLPLLLPKDTQLHQLTL